MALYSASTNGPILCHVFSVLRPTFAFSRFQERVLIVVHTEQWPDDEQWRSFCDEIEQSPRGWLRVLMISDGGGPNSAQRDRLRDSIAHRSSAMLAVVTDSPKARGIGAILGWFFYHVRSFRSHALSSALDYLQIDPRVRDHMDGEIEQLRQNLVPCAVACTAS